jgi:LysR family transcriptional regulator, nitrogen assimilation regulatory protein
MDLHQLDSFVRVVEAGSFSRAAVVMNLAQPTVSRQVALLEKSVGQRLLVRTGRGAAPTEAGELLLAHARTMLEIARRARDELRELHASPAGRVIVGLPPRLALAFGAGLVQRFREHFPRAVITVTEGLSLHLHEWLIAGRLDLALLFDPPASPLLDCRILLREPLWLVVPPGDAPLPTRVPLAALADYPMVLPSAPNAIRGLVDAVLRPRRISLQVVAEVGAVQTVLTLVGQGVGCTLLPESALHQAGGTVVLRRCAIGPPAIRNTLVLATPRSRPATRLTRQTAQWLAELAARGP